MNYHGEFCNGKYYNSVTSKWVTRLRDSVKGKTDGLKWQQLGCIRKKLFVPINTDLVLVKETAIANSLNYEHLLFILHKLLFNRVVFRKTNGDDVDYLNNYTSLGSKDLYKWLGKGYLKCLQALVDIEYIIPKLSARGTKSYYHGDGPESRTSVFRIHPKLFNYDLFDEYNFFKAIPLSDIKLTVKLAHQHQINSLSNHPVHGLLCKALDGARVNASIEMLRRNHLHETVQEMLLLITQINDKEIYVKPEMDKYGERFHSTFTFTWSALRPFIYFESKPGNTVYLDLRNSQFFFFSLLTFPQTYELIPEYLDLLPIFQNHKSQLSEFNLHSQSGTLYAWCEEEYGFSKLNLMQIFFGSSSQFHLRRRKLPWLVEIIREIEFRYSTNILPSVLQRLESRTLLNKVCFEFLSKHKDANLISIHDGLLFQEGHLTELVNTIEVSFTELNLPVPQFKTFVYSSWPEEKNIG